LDRAPINGRPMYISQCEDKSLKLGTSNAFKYANGLEKNKLFISNLPFSVDKAQLENIFKTVKLSSITIF
jgi:RNA recognition motif-containing protein